jgi:chromosome segregation ATPase
MDFNFQVATVQRALTGAQKKVEANETELQRLSGLRKEQEGRMAELEKIKEQVNAEDQVEDQDAQVEAIRVFYNDSNKYSVFFFFYS